MAVASGSDGNKTRQHIHVHYSFGHSRDNYPRAVARLFKIFVHLRQHLSAQAVNGDGIRRFFQTFYRVTHDITAKRHKSAVGKRVVMAVKARRPNDIGKMRTALKISSIDKTARETSFRLKSSISRDFPEPGMP